MNDALMYAKRSMYSNERRMTREQCEIICDNMAHEFNVALHIDCEDRNTYKLQHITDNGERTLIEAEGTTALYWYMVDMRETFRYILTHFKAS